MSPSPVIYKVNNPKKKKKTLELQAGATSVKTSEEKAGGAKGICRTFWNMR